MHNESHVWTCISLAAQLYAPDNVRMSTQNIFVVRWQDILKSHYIEFYAYGI